MLRLGKRGRRGGPRSGSRSKSPRSQGRKPGRSPSEKGAIKGLKILLHQIAQSQKSSMDLSLDKIEVSVKLNHYVTHQK